MAEIKCIDISAIEKLERLHNENEQGFVYSILVLGEETAVRLLADLKSIKYSEAQALARKAHELKSCSANLGLFNVSSVSQEIESCLYVESELPEILKRLESSVEQGVASLQLLKKKYRL